MASIRKPVPVVVTFDLAQAAEAEAAADAFEAVVKAAGGITYHRTRLNAGRPGGRVQLEAMFFI